MIDAILKTYYYKDLFNETVRCSIFAFNSTEKNLNVLPLCGMMWN